MNETVAAAYLIVGGVMGIFIIISAHKDHIEFDDPMAVLIIAMLAVLIWPAFLVVLLGHDVTRRKSK